MARDGIQALPADLFHLLSAELSDRADFPTLFNCVVSSKQLANAGALSALYRWVKGRFWHFRIAHPLTACNSISHDSPIKGGGSEDLTLAEQNQTVQRWSILWRTIILSALGKTVYPYCRHLRQLDLRDLGNLLDDDKFRGKTAANFFADDLARFEHVLGTPMKAGLRKTQKRFDISKIVAAIGDVITEQSPMLEGLTEPTTGDMLTRSLPQWAPRLSHLQSLDLWDGKALANETVRNLLHVHCSHLQRLRIYSWAAPDADLHLADFLSGMPENTLTEFENISLCTIGPETCSALNHHGKSLVFLKLGLVEEGVLALGFLQGCTALQTINITSFRPSVDLKATQNDVFLQIVEWLKSCKSLADITLGNLVSAPDLLLPVLISKDIRLQKLEIGARDESAYLIKDHRGFHEGLTQQTGLRELILRADPESVTRDDLDVLMNAFCSLKDLRTLNLPRFSDYFSEEHLRLLAVHLTKLEEIYFGGYGLTDLIWPSLASLEYLQNITFSGITNFTADGILGFFEQLGDSNRGLLLSIDAADPDTMMTQEEQDLVREALAAKVDGRFQYQPLRGTIWGPAIAI